MPMVKFFRKIRPNLLSEGRMGKYTKYAIGEIILVVIGILIALQINNWSEKRKAKNIELDYYCELLNDLQLDKEQLETLSEEANQRIIIGKQLIKDLHKEKKDKNELMKDLFRTSRSNAYVPINVSFIDLKTSGNLGLLKNKKLKKMVIKYNSDLESINDIIKGNRDFQIEKFIDSWGNVLELGWQEPSIAGILDLDEELRNLLPNNNWHLDPNSDYFQRYQEVIFINISIASREIELFEKVIHKMKPLEEGLAEACDQ